MKKLFACLAVATVAMSAMAFSVSAEGVTEPEVSIPDAATTTEVTTPAPVVVPNPGTGNAPIALLAIPAAVAAAIVIAKKAK